VAGSPGSCHPGLDKRSWVACCLDEGLKPGRIVFSEGIAIGFIQFAPARLVPRLHAMPYPPPSPDAVCITCFYLEPDVRGMGLGRPLLDSVERTLSRQKYPLLETNGLPNGRRGPPGPAGFFGACGFRVVTGHLVAPLMRLDLRTVIPLQDSMQSLLGRLPLPALRRAREPRPELP